MQARQQCDQARVGALLLPPACLQRPPHARADEEAVIVVAIVSALFMGTPASGRLAFTWEGADGLDMQAARLQRLVGRVGQRAPLARVVS